jgi:hypothetical protein
MTSANFLVFIRWRFWMTSHRQIDKSLFAGSILVYLTFAETVVSPF